MPADPVTSAPRNRLRKGETVELAIDSLAHGGAGVGRTDGLVVFARGGLPGDRVVVEITGGKKRFAEGRVIEVLEAGTNRVPERAPHPGAPWQSLEYATQLTEKQRQVREALERFGEFDLGDDSPIELEDIVPAGSGHDDPAIWNYRNKVEFSFGTHAPEEGGGLALGYHRPGHWEIVEDVDDIVLASERANSIRRLVRDWCQERGLSAYDQDEHFGFLRTLFVREGRRTGDTMVRLMTTTTEPEPGGFDSAGFVAALNTLDPPPTSIIWSSSDNAGNATQDSKDKVLAGEPFIEETILDQRYRISPDAFFQTNSDQTERLYATAIEFAGLTGRELVFDLYCGSGTIGIAMAEHAKHIWGIEIVQDAVEDAAVNANLNGVADADFVAGDMRLALPAVLEHTGEPDVVILDPPRAGLTAKVVRRVLEAGAKRIVYVSCNPTTLAPNLKQMVESGYELRRVRPVDMFPHTPHIECVAVLDLTDDAKRLAVIEARKEEKRAGKKPARGQAS
ncbi:MAG: 23S rRNA (uracil(1939)-C(5))-methyltransferase RlmD [Solirubrobacterales bacterium]